MVGPWLSANERRWMLAFGVAATITAYAWVSMATADPPPDPTRSTTPCAMCETPPVTTDVEDFDP